jgi:hypothetical protein
MNRVLGVVVAVEADHLAGYIVIDQANINIVFGLLPRDRPTE